MNRAVRLVWKIAVGALAVVGLFTLVGRPLLQAFGDAIYKTEIIRTLRSPDGKASGEVFVRSGATVHTTRVRLRPVGGKDWIIYEKGDSDFVPPVRWVDAQTLVIGLPCDGFGRLSNPLDFDPGEPGQHRLSVRFEYPADCAPPRPN